MISDGKHKADCAQNSNLCCKYVVDIVKKYIPTVSGNPIPK